MSHIHDSTFKRIFGRPELAADLLRRRLPPAVIARLDLDRCEPVTGEFIDRALRNRRADLVFRVPWADGSGRVAFVFVLIEHQSTPDPLMAFRVLAYVVETWSRYIEMYRAERGRPPRRLPAVIPLVVHQGTRPWSSPRSLDALIDLPDELRVWLGRHLPALELLIDDLAVPDDDRTGATRLALTAAAVLTMRYVRREDDPGGFLERWGRLIEASIGEPGREAVIAAVGRYLYNATERLSAEALVTAIEAADEDAQEALMTIADRLREEGRAEGEITGEAKAIVKLIRQRLGEPSPTLIARVEAEAGEHTGRWFERILAAGALADLERGLDD